ARGAGVRPVPGLPGVADEADRGAAERVTPVSVSRPRRRSASPARARDGNGRRLARPPPAVVCCPGPFTQRNSISSTPSPAPPPPRPLRRILRNWRERHRHPFNFWIHLLGIPLAVAGVVLFLALPWDRWYWGVGAFVLGYLLQYLGHAVEGNDVG